MKYLANVVTLELHIEKCTGCKKCLQVCPRGVFGLDRKKVQILDRDLCIECGACQNNCEYGALEVNSGVGCAAALMTSMITGKEASCGCDGSDSQACC